jgi:hypothetical protein
MLQQLLAGLPFQFALALLFLPAQAVLVHQAVQRSSGQSESSLPVWANDTRQLDRAVAAMVVVALGLDGGVAAARARLIDR